VVQHSKFRSAIETGRPFALVMLILCLCIFASEPFAQEETDPTADAIALFEEGQDLHEKGNLRGAIELYTKALALIPEFPEAELQKGNAHLSLKETPEAEAAFRRAVELREDWSLALASLGSLLVQKGEFAEAEPLLAKAIKLDEQNYPALSAMAELRLRTNASEAILRELLTTLAALTSGKVNPPASAWASRAAIENRLGDLRSAKASIRRALAIEPSSISALGEAADIALRENDPASAEEFARRLEAAGGDADSVRLFRARALLLRDDVAGAEKVLASVSPDNKDASKLLERIRASAAVDPAELEKELETKPNDPAILGRLCTLYRRSDPPKALQYCQAAYNAEPGNTGHAVGFAAALVQAKNFAAAAELLKKLAATEPENATIRANLATALFQLRRYQEAKLEFLWLIKRQPDLAAAYYFLGVAHDNLGEYLDAMANYQEFLRRAKIAEFKDEIDRINLRLPALDRLIKSGKGKKTNEE